MTSRTRRQSFTGEEEETGRGQWTEVEKRRFLEGLAKYGKDFRRLTDEVGTRDIGQVRRYYTYHKAKMDPDTQQQADSQATPPRSRKRKDAHADEVVITVNRKRNKKMTPVGDDDFASGPPSKMQPTMKVSPHAPVSNHVQRPTATTRKRSPSKAAAAKLDQVQDILPPTNAIYNPPKPKPTTRNHAKPATAKSKMVAKTSSTSVAEETMPSSTSLKKDRLLELLRREEVQSVLSGLLGFLAVIAFKKFVG